MGTATSPIDSGRSAALPLPHLVLGDWYSHGKFLIVPLTCHTTRLSSFQIIQFPSLRSLGVMLFAGLLGRIRNGGQSDRVYGGANHRIWTVYLYWSGGTMGNSAQADHMLPGLQAEPHCHRFPDRNDDYAEQ